MFHRKNKNKDVKPLFQMKTSYDKVSKEMTEKPKDYETIKNLIEEKKENILDLNIKNSKSINLAKSKVKIKDLNTSIYNG